MSDTLISVLAAHAAERPEAPFVTLIENQSRICVNFGDLWQSTLRFAASLEDAGVAPRSTVIIMLQPGGLLYTSFLGAMAMGAVPSFMPFPTAKQQPDLFWNSHRSLFERIQPGAIVVYDAIEADVRAIAPEGTIVLNIATLAQGRRVAEISNLPPESTAFLQHSSGTTGLKKGVMLSHAAVLEQVRAYSRAIDFDDRSVIASWLPLYHDMGLIACFILPLMVGSHVVQLDPFQWVGAPTELLDVITEFRATHSWSPNFAFNHLATIAARKTDPNWDLSSLIAFINCSEPCKADSMRVFSQALAAFGLRETAPQICYAMAETVFAVSQTPLNATFQTIAARRDALLSNVVKVDHTGEDAREIVSCGFLLDGVSVRISDDNDANLPDGHVGEICIQGFALYDGYNKQPELSAEKLRGGWHHTGDLGFLLQDQLYLTGRKDDLLIVRGRNYYAHDLEAIISATPGVKPGRTVVFDIESATIGTTDVICMLEPLDDTDRVELRRAVKLRVESLSGLVLARIVIVPPMSLLKTTSGKISREGNRRAYLENRFA